MQTALLSNDRRSRKRSETREVIFRSALALFAERGLAGTTVEQITERADVGKGTFFNYFPSKEHVFLALAEIQLGIVEAARDDARDGKDPVRAVLLRLAQSLTREPGKSPELLRSLLIANLSGASVREMFTRVLGMGREMVGQILQAGQQRGELRADLDCALHARIFQQMMMGTMTFWALHPHLALSELVEDAIGLYWRGVRAESPTGRNRHHEQQGERA